MHHTTALITSFQAPPSKHKHLPTQVALHAVDTHHLHRSCLKHTTFLWNSWWYRPSSWSIMTWGESAPFPPPPHTHNSYIHYLPPSSALLIVVNCNIENLCSHTQGMKVVRHAGVDSRIIILDDQARQQMTLHFQLSLQCNVSPITGFVRHTGIIILLVTLMPTWELWPWTVTHLAHLFTARDLQCMQKRASKNRWLSWFNSDDSVIKLKFTCHQELSQYRYPLLVIQ